MSTAPHKPKKLVLLGSTGSVGTSAVKVAKTLPEEVELIALAGGSRAEALAEQALETGAKHVCIYDQSQYQQLRDLLPAEYEVYAGEEGLLALSTLPEAEMVLISIIGTAGLHPALAAIQAKKQLAVASKEILVMAGRIIMQEASKYGVDILPVDSEHNAIFQCLADGRPTEEISRLVLTASGGPFRKMPAENLAKVTVADALAHPTWDMGKKISIDSATLFNKGLEMIEARWLFNMPMEKVDVFVHPQSIIHSMVEYNDGSVLAQMNTTDMCFPIQYAINWPRRLDGGLEKLDFAQLARLDFETPRFDDFPALKIAIAAGKAGGSTPAIMNAANEIAVDAFLAEKISFPQIWQSVEQTIEKAQGHPSSNLEDLIAADHQARVIAKEIISQ